MSEPLITLTTDFGDASPYVAAMKGVIFALHPTARIVDLSHSLPRQDIAHAAFFLPACLPYFPLGTLHIIVVDPGVGTDRAILYVELQRQRLLVPDNGCWTSLSGSELPLVIRLAESKYWRQPVSPTFHGRDVFAPVAARLAGGLDPHCLGPVVHEWVRWQEPPPITEVSRLAGQVVFVDRFGNLISNIPGEAFQRWAKRPVRILVGTNEVPRRVRTYGEADKGELVALISSTERLEIAVVEGNAAQQLHASAGTPIQVWVSD
jgi:S-adenosylmethionine hydrolase